MALLAACATNEEPGLRAAGTSTVLSTHPYKGRSAVVTGEDAFTAPTVIAAPIDIVWNALLKALPATGIPVDAVQPASYTAGTSLTNARRKFAGKPISTYLRCGGSAGVAEVADEYFVAISVLAELQEIPEGTQLQVKVTGAANDPFTSVPARNCISKGAIEAELDTMIRELLQQS